MAEDEVNYASIVIKTKKQPQSEGKFLFLCMNEGYSTTTLLKLYEEKNKTQKLATEKKHLTEQIENMTQENQNLIQAKKNLTLQNQNLTTELYEEKNKTQELQTEKKILTEQKKTWNEQNLISAFSERNCSSCQKGWTHSQSSCYAVNNAEPPNQKTWKEAREDCRGKSSDLTVVGDEEEKVKTELWVNNKIKGYWIGLRAEGGKWRWIDGSDLTNQAWIQQQPAVDGQCVTSLQNRGWKPVSCDEKNTWICEKKALSV
uniref:C-type lectin domain-containing protein n=1 Tax=Fundulus heteroclitus TaxID=8078 RepID=A0A3Q2R2E2_FUNHE